MYDQFSNDYDRFVHWAARLAAEMPFIERHLNPIAAKSGSPLRVLDAACGTGMHAIALAQKGYLSAGADMSEGMINQARANARREGVDIRFEAAGFGSLAETFGASSFDALLCLGNSLPHLLSQEALPAALDDFAACLRPGGQLLVQNRNFDKVLANKERWMGPQAYRGEGGEWLFLRFYDFDPDGLISFHVVTLRRDGSGTWTQQITSTRLWPMRQNELEQALVGSGFTQIEWYGDMTGSPFKPENSENLVLSARK